MPEGNKKIKCLTDIGASAIAFVDESFARRNRLDIYSLLKLYRLKLANDNFAKNIIYMAKVTFNLNDYIDEIWAIITTLNKYDLILGIP